MRIKKISNDKIVVQLTDSDLEYFDVDIDNATPQSTDLHKFLFEVMELVKRVTGFAPYNGGQVVVEAAMSQNGMSLTISKIRTGNSSITREQFNKAKKVTVKSKECVSHTDIAQLAECSGIRKRNLKKMHRAVRCLYLIRFQILRRLYACRILILAMHCFTVTSQDML